MESLPCKFDHGGMEGLHALTVLLRSAAACTSHSLIWAPELGHSCGTNSMRIVKEPARVRLFWPATA